MAIKSSEWAKNEFGDKMLTERLVKIADMFDKIT